MPILANDPWVPGTNEADEIDAIVLEEMGLSLKPRDQDGKRKFDNMVVQYAKSHVPASDISYEYQTSPG